MPSFSTPYSTHNGVLATISPEFFSIICRNFSWRKKYNCERNLSDTNSVQIYLIFSYPRFMELHRCRVLFHKLKANPPPAKRLWTLALLQWSGTHQTHNTSKVWLYFRILRLSNSILMKEFTISLHSPFRKWAKVVKFLLLVSCCDGCLNTYFGTVCEVSKVELLLLFFKRVSQNQISALSTKQFNN